LSIETCCVVIAIILIDESQGRGQVIGLTIVSQKVKKSLFIFSVVMKSC